MIQFDEKLYNSQRKRDFLNEVYSNPSTRKTNELYLTKLCFFEKLMEKDVCDFDKEELIDLLKNLYSESENSLNVIFAVICTYNDWCIYNRYSKSKFPNYKCITKEDKRNCVYKRKFFTRDEMYAMCDKLYNYGDKGIIVSLFENIRGRPILKNSFEEIRNLKKTHLIPEANVVIATRDNDTDRLVKIHPKSMEILVKASQEEEYFKENGQAKGTFATRPYRDTDYIFRTIENGSFSIDNDDRINVGSIENKFRNIRRYLNLESLNATILFDSGLLEKCEVKLKEVGTNKLKPEHFRKILIELKLNDNLYTTLQQKFNLYHKNRSF